MIIIIYELKIQCKGVIVALTFAYKAACFTYWVQKNIEYLKMLLWVFKNFRCMFDIEFQKTVPVDVKSNRKLLSNIFIILQSSSGGHIATSQYLITFRHYANVIYSGQKWYEHITCCFWKDDGFITDRKDPPQGWPQQGEITFENYSVRYRSCLDLVLKNINITFKPNEKVRFFVN